MTRRTARLATARLSLVVLTLGLAPALAADLDAPKRTQTLTETLRRVRNPALRAQVRDQLKRARVAREDVVCETEALDAGFARLAGTPAGPFSCRIGSRTLAVAVTPRFKDAAGVTLAIADPDLKTKAVAVRDTRMTWRWRRGT